MKSKRSLIVVFIVGLVIGGVSGGAYQIGRASAASNGLIGTSTTGYALQFDGNASQGLNSGGLVKAMLYVDPTRPVGQQFVRCYNSQMSGTAISTPPCGFTLTNPSAGEWYINFGFDISQRFAAASSFYYNYGVSVGYGPDASTGLDNHTIGVAVFETDAHPPVLQNDGKFTLVVY